MRNPAIIFLKSYETTAYNKTLQRTVFRWRYAATDGDRWAAKLHTDGSKNILKGGMGTVQDFITFFSLLCF